MFPKRKVLEYCRNWMGVSFAGPKKMCIKGSPMGEGWDRVSSKVFFITFVFLLLSFVFSYDLSR
jgi:hypothetical protein